MTRILPGASVGTALLLVLVTLFAESEIARAALQKRKAAISSQRTKKAAEPFNRNCARCHGADGRGETPLGHLFKAPDFTDPGWWKKNNTSNRNLAAIVARGRRGMPAFGKKLKRSEIDVLVRYVRRFRN